MMTELERICHVKYEGALGSFALIFPPSIIRMCFALQNSGKSSSDACRWSPSGHFKSDVSVLLVFTVHIVIHEFF